MNREKFYDTLRPTLNLTIENVAGMEFLLDRMEAERIPLGFASNMIGTFWWETGQRMQPIDELGGAAYFNRRYGPGTRVGKVLGNTRVGDGALFHGRGYVQLTGRSNYAKASKVIGVDLIAQPEMAKVPTIAWQIARDGMTKGWYTGKKLGDYIDNIDESDAEDRRENVNARRVVNGTDQAGKIADLAITFEMALKASGFGEEPNLVELPTKTLPASPGPPEPAEPPVPMGWFSRFIRWIFKRS